MGVAPSTDDYALEAVPHDARKGWLQLAWGTTGIVTTLVTLFVGALVTFVAGLHLALVGGVIVMIAGATFGCALGHVACRTGLSSTMIARVHGFSSRGAAIPAAFFSFMMIGFIAMENLLLYKALLFFFGLPDTPGLRVLIYGLLTITWVALTLFGFNLVTRTASFAQTAFLAVLIYMMITIVGSSGISWATISSFPTQLSEPALASLGIGSEADKLLFCINLMIGSAGALALVDADLGRYARRTRDIAIAACLGNLFMNVLLIAAGGIIMFAGMPMLIDYYTQVAGLSPARAQQMALESPDQVAASFIIFGGIVGAVLMTAAQLKAQVLNTYSSSLSLTNLSDAIFGWRPGRIVFVVAANILSFVFLFGDAIMMFKHFLSFLGVVINCLVAVMVADYFLVDPLLEKARRQRETGPINWAGIAAFSAGIMASYFSPAALNKLPFLTAVVVTTISYLLFNARLYFPKETRPLCARTELQIGSGDK